MEEKQEKKEKHVGRKVFSVLLIGGLTLYEIHCRGKHIVKISDAIFNGGQKIIGSIRDYFSSEEKTFSKNQSWKR